MKKLRAMLVAVFLFGAAGAQASGGQASYAILRGSVGGVNTGTCQITQVGHGALLSVSVKGGQSNPTQIFDADGNLITFHTASMTNDVFVQWVYPERLNLSQIHVVMQPVLALRSSDEAFFEAVSRTMEQGRRLGTCTFAQEQSE